MTSHFLTRKLSSLWPPLDVGYTYHPGYLPFLVISPSPLWTRQTTVKTVAGGKNNQNFPAIVLCLESYWYSSSWSSVEETGVLKSEWRSCDIWEKNWRSCYKMEHMSGVPVLRWSAYLAFLFVVELESTAFTSAPACLQSASLERIIEPGRVMKATKVWHQEIEKFTVRTYDRMLQIAV